MSGCDGSTPAIEYVVLLMFVCGGLTTCCTICCGVVMLRRKLRNCAGRHWANAPRSKPPPRKPPPPPPPRLPPPLLLFVGGAVGNLPEAWSFWMHARTLFWSAWLNRKRTRPAIVRRWPPVFSLATIFGTVP